MAADILLYGAKWVPVGDDQTQHLEIARDLALRVNHKFAALFPEGVFTVPEEVKKQQAFIKRDSGGRIRSLVDPLKKMSKSVKDPKGTILLSDIPADAAKKIMGATTDSLGIIRYDWEQQPGITNLLEILAQITERSIDDVREEWTGRERYGELKKEVANAVEQFLTNFQAAYHSVDTIKLFKKLETDEAAMREVANATLLKVQRAVGLRER